MPYGQRRDAEGRAPFEVDAVVEVAAPHDARRGAEREGRRVRPRLQRRGRFRVRVRVLLLYRPQRLPFVVQRVTCTYVITRSCYVI